MAPTIIFFEDIDLFGKDREFEYSPYLGELLNQIDGIKENDGIFLIATTNRPQLIDRALLNRPSRFDIRIEFKKPEEQERRMLVKKYADFPMDDEMMDYLIRRTKDMTPAEIKEVAVYSSMLAIQRGVKVDYGILRETLKRWEIKKSVGIT